MCQRAKRNRPEVARQDSGDKLTGNAVDHVESIAPLLRYTRFEALSAASPMS
jgi:hypothetical protein